MIKDKDVKKINTGGIDIPFYNRIKNLGLGSFEKTRLLIDNLECSDHEKEWEKVKILIEDFDYIDFLSKLSRINEQAIIGYLDEFYKDQRFRSEFSQKLIEFEKEDNPYKGDIRFHSLTLYALIRAIRPELVVETGVAYGKSSALILCAMEHNQKGRLFSVDLPNDKRRTLADGARTNTGNYDAGWLVPDYLKKRWDLNLGDARKILPGLLSNVKRIDVFLHDSLHTYEHVEFELNTVFPRLRNGSLVMCVNINLEAGSAFNDFLNSNDLIGYAYRDLGGAIVCRNRA